MLDSFISIPLEHAGLVNGLLMYKYSITISSATSCFPSFIFSPESTHAAIGRVTGANLCKQSPKFIKIMTYNEMFVERCNKCDPIIIL